MPTVDQHYKIIERAVLGGARDCADWRMASWARCLHKYELDPSRANLIELGRQDLKLEAEQFGFDLRPAVTELEKTLQMIEGGGYSAQIANRNGTIIEERRSKDSTFYCSSDTVGFVWSEQVGGTNGIGTAIETASPSAVFLSDHFFAELTGQACAAAPFFDPDASLLGVVNLSTRNPALPRLAHRVAFGVAQATAVRLETQYFVSAFERAYILEIMDDRLSPALVAFDNDYRVLGATRAARSILGLNDSAIGSRSLWGIFEKIRGKPGPEYLVENVGEMRPLGSRHMLDVRIVPPKIQFQKQTMPPVSAGRGARKPAITYPSLTDCVGSDSAMVKNADMLQRVYGSGLHILLLGETGVGKDTLIRALHYESARALGPFVAFNCSAVPESLIDSELFGYSSGAFTGANKSGNPGRIVEADTGTLFLDEIGDMPLTLQTRLLRFLETGEVVPLGSGKVRTVDVQVVAATHNDLAQKVAEGTFRQDLLYRLAGAVVLIPALRERDDIDEVISTVFASVSEGECVLSDSARAFLRQHDWPGNIRELRNVLKRAVHLCSNSEVQVDDVVLTTPRPTRSSAAGTPTDRITLQMGARSADGQNRIIPARLAADEAEKNAIAAAVSFNGDADAAAQSLGISRATLYRRLKRYGLAIPR